jgi:hypothetical protein
VTIERIVPALASDERSTLAAFLDFQRATLAIKCDGLTDQQLREQAVPPSNLSLLGLVRHMAEVEREASFREASSADTTEAISVWKAECEHSRMLAAAATSLDAMGDRGGGRFSLRWVMVHMIEEYARHNGHADLLRERLDGSTGQ